MTTDQSAFTPSPHLIETHKAILEHLIATNQIEDIMSNARKSGSFQAQIIDLAPGESCSKVRAADPTTPVSRLPEELPALRQQLRNVIAPAVKRATEQTGAAYTTEVGETVMPGGTLYIVGIVTRKPE